MDDKIKEVMGLVCSYGLLCSDYDTDECDLALSRMGIESKLRELVQVPPGYALVPVEASDAMETAAENDYELNATYFPRWKEAWAAMVAAAQQGVGLGEV